MQHTITLLLLCMASTLLARQPENEKTLRIGQAVMHPDDFNNTTSGVLPIADSIAMTLHTTHKYVALAEQVYWHIDTSASSEIAFHPAPPNLHFTTSSLFLMDKPIPALQTPPIYTALIRTYS